MRGSYRRGCQVRTAQVLRSRSGTPLLWSAGRISRSSRSLCEPGIQPRRRPALGVEPSRERTPRRPGSRPWVPSTPPAHPGSARDHSGFLGSPYRPRAGPRPARCRAARAVDEFIERWRIQAQARDRAIQFFREYFEDPRGAAIRNGTIFGHQLLLAGVSQGLAGFWLGGFDEAAIRHEFGLPERAVVAGIVGLGWPKSSSQQMPRQPLDRLVGWGRRPESR